ncbi:mitochondrial splicing system protein [Puccinia graminis f. sp. tritici]|uniref:Mitochondrial splicing system protein n=1 Tax=Puccinia graminis f. sp. tritici TaxID=56615 RepID=A0A5B0QGZ1_PUCGR|nr:mitochondrial splicing system protein [Puccinia graminis f. sp. tritici]
MRKKLKQSIALCEAIIDFSEDGSMDDLEIWKQVIDHLLDLQKAINTQLSQSKQRKKISMGIKVSLYGSPNVGKSTLRNYLGLYYNDYLSI